MLSRVETESHRLEGLRTRPALADPFGQLARWSSEVAAHRERGRRAAAARVADAVAEVNQLAAQVGALSPASTLRRGYAVLQRADGAVVTDPDDVDAGETLSARLAEGRLDVTVTSR